MPRIVLRPLLVRLLLLALVAGASARAADEAWLAHPLTDAATGERFTVGDFGGAVVVVETMATWCSNCRRQLANVSAAAAALAAEHPAVPVVFLAISVERGLAAERLVDYAERNGFGLRWAVADDELLRLLADRFGRTVLNPPSTPHWIVDVHGRVGPLTTGSSTPKDIVDRVLAAAR